MTDIFCDTSVLVAACVQAHPHHIRAAPIISQVLEGNCTGGLSQHSIAECYSALTTIPIQPKITPIEAEQLIETNILGAFRTVRLADGTYKKAMHRCALAGLRGGIIYDALIIECAISAKAKQIYTFNLSDFQTLAPELNERIVAP